MRIIRILTMTLAAAVMAAISCTSPEMMPEEKAKAVAAEDSPVTVTLDLNLADEVNATPGTKAIDDPLDPTSTEIRNLCVLQYRGITENATLVGVHYFSKDITDEEDEHYLAADYSSIKLTDSWGATHTLVILANTFTEIDPPGQGDEGDRTLGDMLHAFRAAESEAAVFGHTGSGAGFPTDVDYYQRLNAVVVTQVSNGKIVHAKLRRSMSRIKVEIVNTVPDDLEILSVQLMNVSQKDYYLTDYSYITNWNSWSDYSTSNLISEPFHDEYGGAVPYRMDYRARTWAEGNPTALSGGSFKTNYTWYVPCNMRGTDPNGNTLPEMKGSCSNAQGATYIKIIATYGANNNPVEYRFYLGKNLYDNFDLDPGKSYSYKFTFNGKGRPSTDGRVTAWGEDFTVDANCYMVAPPPTGTGPAVYTFNVVHRINTFWGSPDGDRYGYYVNGTGEYPNNYINSGETWKARILWSDFTYDRDVILTRKTGTGAGSYMSDSQRVEISIPAGITHGNLVIGVWTDNPDNILWSWHIWITDYRPDDAGKLHPIADTYVYKVTGGEVHRYGGSVWTTGRYKDAFIMDRNLGALRDSWSNDGNPAKGDGFYYQFGRKDPFSISYNGYTYAYAGESSVNYNGESIAMDTNHRGVVSPTLGKVFGEANRVPYSINNPRRFIVQGGNWTWSDMYTPSSTSIVWQDPKNSIRGDNEEGVNGNAQNKSIFDPCPPGWCVPVKDWTNGFSATTNFVWNVESTYGRGRGKGRTYFPEAGGYEGNKNNPNRQTIFFPVMGGIDNTYNSMTATGIGSTGHYWTSSPNTWYAYYFELHSSNIRTVDWYRATARSVRCIHE